MRLPLSTHQQVISHYCPANYAFFGVPAPHHSSHSMDYCLLNVPVWLSGPGLIAFITLLPSSHQHHPQHSTGMHSSLPNTKCTIFYSANICLHVS